MITIDLLSAFRLTCDGQPVVLQHRRVLLIHALWCAAGPVPAESLLRRLQDRPGPASRITLRSHISRTRAAVAIVGRQTGELIITRQAGLGQTTYQLAEGLEVDAERFRELARLGTQAVGDGDFERGGHILGRALALWGNDPDDDRRPLPEAADQPFAQERRLRLRDLRKDAMLAMLTAFVSLGRHREAVAELEQITREYPDEGAAPRLLAVALYRCERIGDAAAVCRRAIEDLRAAGHDDAPFQELQHAILNRTLPMHGALAS